MIIVPKLVNPLMSTEARGKLGGVVYNTWRGTRYAKIQSSPAQPRSSEQLQIRAILSLLSRSWQSLTAAQRQAWSDYAETHTETDWTNTPKRITGLNWYIRLNTRLMLNGWTTIATPPSEPAPPAPTNLEATGGIGQIEITWDNYAGTGTSVEIWLDGPHSAGRSGSIIRAKKTSLAAGETGTDTITGLRPGTYTVYARAIDEARGLVSPWASDTATVTAT